MLKQFTLFLAMLNNISAVSYFVSSELLINERVKY